MNQAPTNDTAHSPSPTPRSAVSQRLSGQALLRNEDDHETAIHTTTTEYDHAEAAVRDRDKKAIQTKSVERKRASAPCGAVGRA